MKTSPIPIFRRPSGITLMECLVVAAIIVALTAIAVPIVNVMHTRTNRVAATKTMQTLGAATLNYCAQNDNKLPDEDAPGSTSWLAAAKPENANVWFNALPKQLGMKPVSEFATNAAAFYTKQNLLFVPGAHYPESNRRLIRPLFAISFNRHLEQRNANGNKFTRMSDVEQPTRTVLYIEEGLPSEKVTVVTQPHYSGGAKGDARSFVGRYSGKGLLTFCDGHADLVDPNDTLDPTGVPVTPPVNYIWTPKP